MGCLFTFLRACSARLGYMFCRLHVYKPVNSDKEDLPRLKGRFRRLVWDPPLIIVQMVAMQSIYYTTMGLLAAGFLSVAGYYPHLGYVFNWKSVHVHSRDYQITMISFVLNSFCGSFTLWYIVQRAKQCLDYTCTIHFFHFVACWTYSGDFPTSMMWWLIQVVCIVLMAVIGEYLCFKTALKEIPLFGVKTEV